ncbi:MAG: spore coat U domain-containing protein [Pseudomonadota bacterium]|nr:spore coat U domain-containing protein [Pseudomonadota bacterium]
MNRRHSKFVVATISAMFGVAAGSAFAAEVTDTFDVRIVIENSCVINSGQTTDMDFNTQQLLSSNFDAQSAIGVTCTTDLPYTIGLSAGDNATGGTNTRRMANAGDTAFVAYDLYQDVSGGAHWGNDIGTDTKGATGTGAAQTHTVYGRVASQTTPPAGAYEDTITVTVDY